MNITYNLQHSYYWAELQSYPALCKYGILEVMGWSEAPNALKVSVQAEPASGFREATFNYYSLTVITNGNEFISLSINQAIFLQERFPTGRFWLRIEAVSTTSG